MRTAWETECPVCGNNTLEPGEQIDVGVGFVKGGPDHCHTCGYIEQGPNPDDPPIEHYKRCWEQGISPHPSPVEERKRPLRPEYVEWIESNVSGGGYGECLKTSLAMMRALSGLRLVYGTYLCLVWGSRDHFWLIDSEGYIVDPTAAQFPTGGSGWYEGTLVPEDSHLLRNRS